MHPHFLFISRGTSNYNFVIPSFLVTSVFSAPSKVDAPTLFDFKEGGGFREAGAKSSVFQHNEIAGAELLQVSYTPTGNANLFSVL